MAKRHLSGLVLWAWTGLAAMPKPAATPPGDLLRPPSRATAPGAPLIYEHSGEAGADETFLLVGENLTHQLSVWGASADLPDGQEWKARVQFLTNGMLAATLPEQAHDGVFLVWARNAAGYSEPMTLNGPQPWWCGPDTVPAGATARVFGRNLARRPDFSQAFVYLCPPGRAGTWAEVLEAGKYEVTFRIPQGTVPGAHEVWVHTGAGGEWGWGGPLQLRVTKSPGSLISMTAPGGGVREMRRGSTGAEIQRAMDALSERGGGRVVLPGGTYHYSGTLRVPANVILQGAGREATTLQLVRDPAARFDRLDGSGWSQAPGAIHTVGDLMEYDLMVPQAGSWTVWLRYATDMAPWNQPGVSGNHALLLDDGAPMPLEHLENTGGFGTFRWSQSASLPLTAGRHKLTWKNLKGGGISLDALVFTLEPGFVPRLTPPPTNSATTLVLQAEDCTRFVSKEGKLPGGNRAAVWLSASGAGLENLTVLGNAQVNWGIALGSRQSGVWLTNCLLVGVRVLGAEGKQGENCGLYLRRADHAVVRDNELWGRAPVFLAGARQSQLVGNRLVSVTRYGGNAEAAILGRNETIEECIVERNVIATPPGAEGGGPTARRLLWFSTGHGSITRNWIARNGVEPARGPGAAVGAGPARFGGVAGTDQNVGEMILFEANHRTAYFGPLAAADAQSVTLPKTLPPTPDERLGTVKRSELAHDAQGNETPFWPPDFDDGTEEPPLCEYYVTVMAGRGQGQTRRVVRREGERLWLDQPWRVPPRADSRVVMGTAFYRNLLVGNYTPDGMTGIQLWISCVENVVSGNSIARQRKPALYLYANGTTLASSMRRTWNRGLSPLFWNLAEGNRSEECSAGALLTSGDERNLPIEFPRALGNVLRHNSFVRNRTDGVVLTSRSTPSGVKDTAPSIAGTVCEFNVVRDATVAYHVAQSADAVVLRRNHAYFWYPVNQATNAPVAFALDRTNLTVVLEQNSIEGIHGAHDGTIQDLKTPAGVSRWKE